MHKYLICTTMGIWVIYFSGNSKIMYVYGGKVHGQEMKTLVSSLGYYKWSFYILLFMSFYVKSSLR